MLTPQFFADYKEFTGETFYDSVYKRKNVGTVPLVFTNFMTAAPAARSVHFAPSPTTCGVCELVNIYGTYGSTPELKTKNIKGKVFSAILTAVANNRGLMSYYQPVSRGLHSSNDNRPGGVIHSLESWGFKMNPETFYNPNSGNTLGEWRIHFRPFHEYSGC